MEEVDSIIVYTLRQIGCDVDAKLSNFGPQDIVKAVSVCLKLIKPELDIPSLSEAESMSGRYKVASSISQLVLELGYKEEIGCQSFLYPAEEEVRKILIFLVERLPKDIEGDAGTKLEMLLSKISEQEKVEEEFSGNNEILIDGIRFAAAVDVDSLPKETLKFYASHLADISFAKMRQKMKPKVEQVKLVESIETHSDDDFGDPDEPEEPSVVESIKEVQIKPPKPAKPIVPPKPNLEEEEAKRREAEEERTREEIKALQESTRQKALDLKMRKEKILKSQLEFDSLEEQISTLRSQLEAKENHLDRKRKTQVLLQQPAEGLEKIKRAIEGQMEKLLHLATQWETHRVPIIQLIRTRRAGNSNKKCETAVAIEEIRRLKDKLREMGGEAKNKEEMYASLLVEQEKMSGELSRAAYTARILEIIGNIKKQKKEIGKVLKDTREIQKEINSLRGKLGRTFAVADELIFKEAEKDKSVAKSYKLLVSIHSEFRRVGEVCEEMGSVRRNARDVEEKLALEKAKDVGGKMERLTADLGQMKKENLILTAKLREPEILKQLAEKQRENSNHS